MSTVAMMLEAAERLSKDRAVTQNAPQVPRKNPKDRVHGERDQKKEDKVNNVEAFHS